MKLTKFELAVLTAIDNSEYGEYLLDEIWSFSVTQNMPEDGPKGRSISGVVSSLSKKGLVHCGGTWGQDMATIGMTEAGVKLYVETITAAGGKVKKIQV